MQQAQMTAAQAVKMASESKERIGNTAAPAICDRKNGDIFRRYDQDEDGMLSSTEVVSFCRLEYGFALPQGNLDRILQHLATTAPGAGTAAVEPKRFHQLRTAVGIARFEARAKKAKEAKMAGDTAGDTAAAAAAAEDEKLKLEFQNHLKQRQQQMEKEMEQIAWTDLEKKIADVESTSATRSHWITKCIVCTNDFHYTRYTLISIQFFLIHSNPCPCPCSILADTYLDCSPVPQNICGLSPDISY